MEIQYYDSGAVAITNKDDAPAKVRLPGMPAGQFMILDPGVTVGCVPVTGKAYVPRDSGLR